MGAPRSLATQQKRLFSRIIIDVDGISSYDDAPCWISTYKTNQDGYVRVAYEGRPQYLHVVTYRLWRGPIPPDKQLDHMCHDPDICKLGRKCLHRACCNPFHTEPKLPWENGIRGNSPHALNAKKACCLRCGSDFTLLESGNRRCDPCARERAADWYADNHEHGLVIRRQYRADHLEDLREYDRNRPRNGTEEHKAYMRSYYAEHREEQLERRRAKLQPTEAGRIRSWAREHGFEVQDRGRISPELRRLWQESATD
jgi:hypothetical protein